MPDRDPIQLLAESVPDPGGDPDVKDLLLTDYGRLGVGELVDELRERFPGAAVTGQPGRAHRDERTTLWTTFVVMTAQFEGGRMAQQRGIRNLARRAYRVIKRYAEDRGYTVAELNTYCEGVAEPPSAHFYVTAVSDDFASRYSRRERSKKNWWVREPVDHGPQ